MLTADNSTPVLDNPEPGLPEETSEPTTETSLTADADEVLTEQDNGPEDGTEAEEAISPSTGSLPSMLPTQPDISWDEDDDDGFIDLKDEQSDSEDEGVSFDTYESFLSPSTAGMNLDLDPAVALALRSRSLDEIIAEDGLEHAEAVLKAEEEEAIRFNYFRTESPERAEQIRLEKEELARQEKAEREAKRKAIADRAEHGVNAKLWGRSALAFGLLAVVSFVTSLILGGA